MREGKRKETKEWVTKDTETLFFTLSVLLERSRRDNYNHILKEHQMKS